METLKPLVIQLAVVVVALFVYDKFIATKAV